MKSLKREKDDFEPNSEMYGEPVKLMKYYTQYLPEFCEGKQSQSHYLGKFRIKTIFF